MKNLASGQSRFARGTPSAGPRAGDRAGRLASSGEVLGGCGVASERHTQQQLQLFRRLIDQSSEAILVVDPENAHILDVNERACTNLGYTRGELLALSMPDIESAYDGFTWSEQVEQVRQGRLEQAPPRWFRPLLEG